MGAVQYFLAVILSVQLVFSFPTQTIRSYKEGERKCNECPAGEFQKSCTECTPCPPGRYTDVWNREHNCHRCFRDCSPENHMKVVQNCTSKTPLICACETGYRCIGKEEHYCKKCEKEVDTTASADGLQTSSAQTKPCSAPWCGPSASPTTSDPKPVKAELAAILVSVVFIVCLVLMILFCINQPREETCFRQIIAKMCNEEGVNATHKAKESSHHIPRNFSAKQQTTPLSAANLVHVHNPSTVIFSFLTGLNGSTAPGRKRAETASIAEEDERDCPVFHPMPSPSVHLSEEEGRGETEDIFFPSQEQGKDYHMSKEEVL
ncbi:PREDICTED: tumor necrosis factor receptor superfamily member 5-like [Cyprinodon variegatus]|uniref:tumor necrosis factor receptor superfamily member 5-like n=1 Tax=Cyprinodon variegatus TaxID=28743 RepID=UPI00074293C2|nr:PREDICTED: tumor necrosis factor receptor superfamily member 5-like [Cyprinodon variegatus]